MSVHCALMPKIPPAPSLGWKSCPPCSNTGTKTAECWQRGCSGADLCRTNRQPPRIAGFATVRLFFFLGSSRPNGKTRQSSSTRTRPRVSSHANDKCQSTQESKCDVHAVCVFVPRGSTDGPFCNFQAEDRDIDGRKEKVSAANKVRRHWICVDACATNRMYGRGSPFLIPNFDTFSPRTSVTNSHVNTTTQFRNRRRHLHSRAGSTLKDIASIPVYLF